MAKPRVIDCFEEAKFLNIPEKEDKDESYLRLLE
tara:strand:+ start:286 stop:387 length:102 start_codon:yes stop_codon:yes gene_type:complete